VIPGKNNLGALKIPILGPVHRGSDSVYVVTLLRLVTVCLPSAMKSSNRDFSKRLELLIDQIQRENMLVEARPLNFSLVA
jgi:hypothetical protein